LNCSANFFSGFFINAKIIIVGISPSTRNKIIPGIKKDLKGELPKLDNGIRNNSPEGDMIIAPPPTSAPNARNANKKIRK
jgi:hypothetical protein